MAMAVIDGDDDDDSHRTGCDGTCQDGTEKAEIDQQINETWMNGWMSGWVDGQTDRWIYGWMNKPTENRRKSMCTAPSPPPHTHTHKAESYTVAHAMSGVSSLRNY